MSTPQQIYIAPETSPQIYNHTTLHYTTDITPTRDGMLAIPAMIGKDI